MDIARRAGYRITVILSFIIGVILAVAGEDGRVRSVHVGPMSGALLSAIGEAFIVAGLLAVIVDRRVKVDLTREIAKETSTATSEVFFREFLGGKRLPLQYYEEMRRLAATDILSQMVSWELRFEWTDDRRYLKVTSGIRNTLTNLGTSSFDALQPWLINYRDNRPSPYLSAYNITVSTPASESETVRSVVNLTASEHQLARMNRAIEELSPTVKSYLDLPPIPSRAEMTYFSQGVTFHDSAALMPLIVRWPTLRQELTISGPALADIEISVLIGMEEPTVRSTGTDGREVYAYTIDRLAISGSTIRVQWWSRDGMATPNADFV
jgi:hypothetical protein